MATSDGESCSAEERALKDWEDLPWEEGDFWEPLEAARLNIIRCYKEAFRAGFRAGQKSGAEYLELVKRVETCEDRLCWVESCEDRLCCIEKAPYIDDRIIEHQKRVEALEQTTDKLCRQVSAGGSHLSLEFSKMRRLEQRVLELEQAVEKRS